MRRYFLLMILFLTLPGCITTEFFSKQNLEIKNLKYQRILIQFADVQPDYAQFGERQVKSAVELAFGKTIQCYLYSDEFYTGLRQPKEMLSDLEKFKQEKNIDAVLICVGRRGIKKETNILTNPGMSAPIYANNDQKQLIYRMELIDPREKKSVWYSTTQSEGNAFFNSYKDMIKIFIDKSVKDLKVKDLLGEDNRTAPGPEKERQEPRMEI